MHFYILADVPEPPHSLDNDGVYSRNITLIWTIPHDNNAPILGYFIFFTNPFFINGGSPVVIALDENVAEVAVEGLHPGESYNFTIIAFNEEGNSLQSKNYTVQTLEESKHFGENIATIFHKDNLISEPDGPPLVVNARPLSATSVSIKWAPPAIANRLGVISSYDVMYAARDEYGRIAVMKWKSVRGFPQL